jgi:diguanylate cyclase (GGDEF)-like protein
MTSFNPEQFLILVVDDMSQNLQVVGSILDDIGYATTFATTGDQAIKRVSTAKPDLILLDLMMPEVNGLEVCKILKSDPNHQEIPIMFLTASNEKEHLIQAFEEGAVDYITKPFSVPELLARVRTHLELKHTRDELKKALMELEKLATTDPLTGVYNRRQLFKIGEQELQRSQRHNRPLSILMLDIDHFKKINDLYGHSVGDQALIFLTETIIKSLRTSDFFGRFGGEEFVVILPETTLTEALDIAERLRRHIAEISFLSSGQFISLTVSIGVANFETSSANFDYLLHKADQALYEAKHQGRNRVVTIDNDPWTRDN